MIDIHSHIIPNVDDGSKSVNETFKMIEEAKKIGFTDIILTSHFLLNHYETNSKELIFWKDKLQEVLDKYWEKDSLHQIICTPWWGNGELFNGYKVSGILDECVLETAVQHSIYS